MRLLALVLASCAEINPAALPPGMIFQTFVNRTGVALCSIELGGPDWRSPNLLHGPLDPGQHATSSADRGANRVIARDCDRAVVVDAVADLRGGSAALDLTTGSR